MLYFSKLWSYAADILPSATRKPEINPMVSVKNKNRAMLLPRSEKISRPGLFKRGFFIFFSPLPLKLASRNLMLVKVVVSYPSVSQPYNAVGHIFDGIVVGDENYRALEFLIYTLNKIENVL